MRVLVAWLCACAIAGGVASASEQAHATQPAKSETHAAAPAAHGAKPAEPAAHGAAEPKAGAKDSAASSHGTAVHDDVKPAVKKSGEGSTKAKADKPATVSPVELANRLQKILDEDSAKRQNHAQAPTVAPKTAGTRTKATRTTRPTALLTWEAEPQSGGVTLSWDPEIDPRRPGRPLPTGVRLNWPEGRE